MLLPHRIATARVLRGMGVIAVLTLALVVSSWRVPPSPFDPAPYLGDFHALEDSLARGYANLEWQVSQGEVDPVALHRRTDSLLRRAKSDGDARAALTAFGAAFHDGHLRVDAPPSALLTLLRSVSRRDGAAPPSVSFGATKACKALGYSSEGGTSPLARHDAYRVVGADDAPFRTGIITTDVGTIGVMRIGSFGVDRFIALCEHEWPAAAARDSAGVCGSVCEDALARGVSNALLAEVRAAIGRVQDAGATALVVDLVGNGGGTNWVAAAARQFTAQPLRGHFVGMIRHPHHERQFVARRNALTRARDSVPLTDTLWRAQLAVGIARTDSLLAMTRRPCDRRALWTTGVGGVTCSQLTSGSYTSGVVEYLAPAFHTRPGAAALFGPADFQYTEGVWRGPLFVLVDGRTASASEEFAALLKDEGGATVVGRRTYGAGCGYTNGGIGFTLPHAQMRVRMPDCARIRRNGRNEVSGIEVDVPASIDADAVVAAVTQVLRRKAPAPDPIAVFERAVERGRAGDRAGALARLDSLTRLPGGLDPSFHRLFLGWRDDTAYQAIVARIRAAHPPIVRSTIAYRIAERDLQPEGIAFDPRTRTTFVGSFKGKIVRIDREGHTRDFAHLGSSGAPRVVVGLRVDTARGQLWAAVADPRAFSDATVAGGALHRFDIATGTLLARYTSHAPGAFNDLIVTPAGDAFATNTSDGSIWRTVPDSDVLQRFAVAGTAPEANGIAFDAQHGALFVAAAHDIVRIDLASGRAQPLVNTTSHPIGSFDGLYWYAGGLVGIQNGVHPGRVVRLTLDASATTVTRADILERYRPDANGMTTAALDGDALFYLVNTQSRAFRADGTPIDARRLTDILVARLPLR